MKNALYDKSRVASFSDAVFSIAITLLILDIDTPSAEDIYTIPFHQILRDRIPDFIGLLVSFLVIAVYWTSHLRVYKYVTKVNAKLLWINIFLLLFVVFLPFSTAVYVDGFTSQGPFVFYCANLVFLGLFNFIMVYYITKTERSNAEMTPILSSWLRFRSLNALVIWLLAALMAFVWPLGARIIFVLIFVIQALGDRYYNKKTIASEATAEEE